MHTLVGRRRGSRPSSDGSERGPAQAADAVGSDADHLQPPRQRAVGELGLLLRGVAEELVVVAERVALRHQHAGRERQQLVERLLHADAVALLGALLLEEPGAVGHVAVLVARDVGEALGEARQQLVLLVVVEHEVLAGQRERALDDHVVGGHEVDLRVHVARVRDQPLAHLHEPLVEELDERVGHVLARRREPLLDAAVDAGHLAEPAVEELHVARLVDLLGREEGLLLLVLVGHHEAGELGGHALLADEERAEPPEVLLPVVVGQLGPVLLVALEVDRLRLPVLALPQLVQLLRVHQLERPVQVGVVGDGRDVALAGEIEEGGHAAILTAGLRRSPQGEERWVGEGVSSGLTRT